MLIKTKLLLILIISLLNIKFNISLVLTLSLLVLPDLLLSLNKLFGYLSFNGKISN